MKQSYVFFSYSTINHQTVQNTINHIGSNVTRRKALINQVTM